MQVPNNSFHFIFMINFLCEQRSKRGQGQAGQAGSSGVGASRSHGFLSFAPDLKSLSI